jgi:predicted Zn finger-like uncharacterized protein
MVVQCPSCKSKYRLNPDKITGRGARITCPKCQHAFKVYREDAQAGSQPAAPAAAAPAAPEGAPPGQAGSFDFAKAMGGQADLVAGKEDAADPAPAAASSATASAKEPAKEASGDPVAEYLGQVQLKRNAQNQPVNSLGQVVQALDFKSVGLRGWKAKVGIGLIYAFDDLRTLQRYMDDKKVTHQDRISYDGKHWHTIAEVGDLAEYFLRVWEAARMAKAAGKMGGRSRARATTSGAARPTQASSGSGYSVDLGTSSSTRQRAPGRPLVPKRSQSAGVRPFHIVVGLLVLVVLWMAIDRLRGPGDDVVLVEPAEPAAAQVQEAGAGPADAESERIREETLKRLEEEERRRIEEAASEAKESGSGEPEERFVPVRRSGATQGGSNP